MNLENTEIDLQGWKNYEEISKRVELKRKV
jgi:hypothetical protein